MSRVQQYAQEECPGRETYHQIHRYCPHCDWVEPKAKIAYLFGPVSGRIEAAKEEFGVAERGLTERGYEVWNPLTRANNPEAEAEARKHGLAAAGRPGWQNVMRPCFRDVLGADELWGLPGWEQSTGARLEVLLATIIGVPVFSITSGEPLALGSFEVRHWRADRVLADFVWPRRD